MTEFVKPLAIDPDEELTREQMLYRLDQQRGIIERRQRQINGQKAEIDHLEGIIKDIRQGRTLANIRADRAEAALREHISHAILKNARF